MDRFQPRRVPLYAALMVGLIAVSMTGCGFVASILHAIDDRDIEAEYNGLQKKRIAVVCRTEPSLKYQSVTVPQELARAVGSLIKQNVAKVTVVDQQKVENWTDKNTSDDFAAIGKALNVDMVVALDLKTFSLYQGQTLYQGKARVNLSVYDIKTGERVFDKPLPQTLFPPNAPVATVERPEEEFKRQFITQLADQIARHFYPHDSTADVAIDCIAQ